MADEQPAEIKPEENKPMETPVEEQPAPATEEAPAPAAEPQPAAEEKAPEERPAPAAPAREDSRGREKYETIKLETINYGTNNFIEVSKKKAPNGNVFISLSKGWYPANSPDKRYKGGIGFPFEQELVDKFKNALETVVKE